MVDPGTQCGATTDARRQVVGDRRWAPQRRADDAVAGVDGAVEEPQVRGRALDDEREVLEASRFVAGRMRVLTRISRSNPYMDGLLRGIVRGLIVLAGARKQVDWTFCTSGVPANAAPIALRTTEPAPSQPTR